MNAAPNINRLWADLILEELTRNGVRHFFIAPGSRSSPLVAAVAQHPHADATIHFDERGASFAALGYGRATGSPAAWITTSGTAAANGLPAVVEAAQSHIPLIALTADRPPELRDTGANQAIDQIRIFGSYARWFFDLPCPTTGIDPAFVLTTVDQAVHRSLDAPPGPVHLNCPYREPLAPSPDEAILPEAPRRWTEGRDPYTVYHLPLRIPDPETVERLRERIVRSARGLFVVGELGSPDAARAVSALTSEIGWPVVADVTSQLRLGEHPALVVSSPHFTCAALAEAHAPDLIVRLGGPISSKDVQRYIDEMGAPVLSVAEYAERRDPGHRLEQVVRASTAAFCEALKGAAAPVDQEWRTLWLDTGNRISAYLRSRLDSDDAVSEPGVAAAVGRLIPESHALFVASSMPIRDVDMFGTGSGRLRRVAANRGASGIDGTVASAFGYHLGADAPVTLLIGDLAILHDLNSLALLRGYPVVVIAVNNRGGGIFNFLPIAEHPEVFEPWFTAPHQWTFEHVAATFGLGYEQPQSMKTFEGCYLEAARSGTAMLIEVGTDRAANHALHRELRSGALMAAR